MSAYPYVFLNVYPYAFLSVYPYAFLDVYPYAFLSVDDLKKMVVCLLKLNHLGTRQLFFLICSVK